MITFIHPFTGKDIG
jgi:serine/threonine protein kinase